MAAPKPSEFQEVVVLSTDTVPQALVKVFIRFPVLLLRWFVTWIDDSGNFTPEFKRAICDACPAEEEET